MPSDPAIDRGRRLATVVLVIALVGAVGVVVLWLDWPKCLFFQFTGMHCPGCGMTRAAHACLRGDVVAALRFNPLLMTALPVAGVVGAWHLAGWLWGRPMPWRVRIGRRLGWTWLGVLVLFWILRNIPQWPFTLLAPP